MKFRLRFESLELLCIEDLSISLLSTEQSSRSSMLWALGFFRLHVSVSIISSSLNSLSMSSQLFAAWDGVCSSVVAFEAAMVGSESRRPSRLRDRFGVGGLLISANDETGVFEPLRAYGCSGGSPLENLLELIIQLRDGLFVLQNLQVRTAFYIRRKFRSC